MPRTTTALTQAQHYLEVLRSIPRHRYASTNEIQNSLALRGIEINTLTLPISNNLPIAVRYRLNAIRKPSLLAISSALAAMHCFLQNFLLKRLCYYV